MRKQRSALFLSALPLVLAVALVCAYGQAPNAAEETPAPATPAPAAVTSPPAGEPVAAVSAPGETAPSAATAAAPSTPAAPAGAQDGEVIVPPPDKMVIEPSEKKDLINVAVDNETLENVVTMFTRITGANIVATATNLNGTVTVNLKDVEWKAALSSILDLHNLALIEKMPGSGVYSIMPKPPLDSQPLVIETIFLKYTTAAELKPVILSMLLAASTNAPSATLSELASRNALIVKTTEPNMREVKHMIEAMDIPSKQVCVEAKFLELNESASKQLGIRWDSLGEFGVRLQAGPFSHNRDTEKNYANSDSMTSRDTSLKTTSETALDGDQSIRQYDAGGNIYIPKTTTTDADGNTIESETPTRTESFGGSSARSSTTESSQEHIATDMNDFSRKIVDSQAAILEMDSLNVILSALKKTEGVQVVSNPKIIVASGSADALFNVGDREPIIKTERAEGTQNSPGDKITSTLDTAINTDFIKNGYLETGIHLQVVPVVKTDDMIEAQIWPKLIRRILPDKTVGDNSWPRISVKEIKTKFTLRSGQTVAIGGLTDTKDNKAVTKVPFLGDIPLIGKYLFSHTADVKAQTETIIFVTLSRAEPADLKENTGIPLDSELVHKRMIQRKIRQEEFDEELKNLEQAAEADRAKKVRSRLLKMKK